MKHRAIHSVAVGAAATLLVTACTTATVEPNGVDPVSTAVDDLMPHFSGDRSAFAGMSAEELAQLQLISTNLVTSLVQIPEIRPASATLQYSEPRAAFGHAVIRALEDAGFGMQRVSDDQGVNYVSYRKSQSQTESGPLTTYSISVDPISVSREYEIVDRAVFPSSLMSIRGTRYAGDIELADDIFREQGAEDERAFISGVQYPDNPDPNLAVDTVAVRDFDQLPPDKRQQPESVLTDARLRYFRADIDRAVPDLERFRRYRRTVLIFNDVDTRMMGAANKQAVRLLVREFGPLDIMVIKACQDVDGRDESSLERAIRVEEELASHEVAPESTWIAPCSRTSFRHVSDNSPAPVEIIHYKPL